MLCNIQRPRRQFDWQGSLICSGFNSEALKDTDVLDYVTEEYAKEHYIAERFILHILQVIQV